MVDTDHVTNVFSKRGQQYQKRRDSNFFQNDQRLLKTLSFDRSWQELSDDI